MKSGSAPRNGALFSCKSREARDGSLFFSEKPLLSEGFPEKNNGTSEKKTIFDDANNGDKFKGAIIEF